jgi:hypothetical protein
MKDKIYREGITLEQLNKTTLQLPNPSKYKNGETVLMPVVPILTTEADEKELPAKVEYKKVVFMCREYIKETQSGISKHKKWICSEQIII